MTSLATVAAIEDARKLDLFHRYLWHIVRRASNPHGAPAGGGSEPAREVPRGAEACEGNFGMDSGMLIGNNLGQQGEDRVALNTAALIAAAEKVKEAHAGFQPQLALILGSGWREAASSFAVQGAVDYASIPELGAPQVAGHGGQILLAEHSGTRLLVFAGRRHWYEGRGWDPIAFPICLAKVMGAGGVVLTNSAGGVHPRFKVGSVMMIEDHVNGMGVNPLAGPHHPFWGERFPDMTAVYDAGYRGRLMQAARVAGVELEHGVYLAVTGPSYETPAEIRAFRAMGADAVGMSTVPEALLAHAAGLSVAGLSCITNAAAGQGQSLSHAEVLAGVQAALPRLSGLLQQFVRLQGQGGGDATSR